MKIQDYLFIIKFILENQKQRLTSDSLKELIDILLQDEIDHETIISFIYDILE